MRSTVVLLFATGLISNAHSAEPPDFDKQLAPLLVKRCSGCHSGDDPKGDFDITRKANVEPAEVWKRVNADEMPPKKPLSAVEKALLKAWIDGGAVGWLVCCTSGDQGGEDPDADPLELAAVREREQRAAAEVIGYAGVSYLHQPDGALANDLALREMLVREIRTFKPDAVFCTDPEAVFHRGGGVNHADHRAAGMAAVVSGAGPTVLVLGDGRTDAGVRSIAGPEWTVRALEIDPDGARAEYLATGTR